MQNTGGSLIIPPQFQALAHRGFARDVPENTLAAFEKAADLGVKWMEIDVHTTADGVVVVFHDCTLNRMLGISGNIADKTWEELQALELTGGHKIPSLEEALLKFPQLYFNIDIKDEASARQLPEVVARLGAVDRVRIASFSSQRRIATLRALQKLEPAAKIKTSASERAIVAYYLTVHTFPALWPVVQRVINLFFEPFEALQVPLAHKVFGRKIPVLTQRFIDVAHKNGLTVQVWTIDDSRQMERLLAMGVDGIVTNRSDTMHAVLEKFSV